MTTKKCYACIEEVHIDATKCKFCHSLFGSGTTSGFAKRQLGDRASSVMTKIGIALMVLVPTAIVIAGFCYAPEIRAKLAAPIGSERAVNPR